MINHDQYSEPFASDDEKDNLSPVDLFFILCMIAAFIIGVPPFLVWMLGGFS